MMNREKYLAPLILSAILGTGCAGDSSSSSSSPTTDKNNDTLTWKSCTFARQVQTANIPGTIECSQTPVPLNWEDNASQKIQHTIVRIKSKNPAKGQIWLLDGGPGGSGLAYLSQEQLALFDSENWDIYIPVHRGTGGPDALTCSTDSEQDDETAQISACFKQLQKQYGNNLQHFNTYGAARDIGHAIAKTSQPSDKVIVFGSSYGTYWAQRYLQFYPDQADAIILDGILDLGSDIEREYIHQDDVGASLLKLCDDNSRCSQALGQPSAQLLRDIYARTGNNRCSLLATEEGVESAKTTLNSLLPEASNILVPVVIKLLDRCEQADIKTLETLVQALEGGEEQEPPLARTASTSGNGIDLSSTADFNDVLSNNVIYTEIFRPVQNADEIESQSMNLLFSPQSAAGDRFALEDVWKVAKSPINTDLGNINLPVLMLQGSLDPQTVPVWADWTKAKLPSTYQHLVVFPHAKHGVIEDSFLSDGANCGATIMQQFINDPHTTLDTSCVAQTLKPDFGFERTDSQELSRNLLNVANPWSLITQER